MMISTGRGAWLGKADTPDVLTVLPLHPSQWRLLGVRWRSKYYLLVYLSNIPFYYICQKACAGNCIILWALLKFCIFLMFSVVDFPPLSLDIASLWSRLVFELGFPLYLSKTYGPPPVWIYFLPWFSSSLMQASLPTMKSLAFVFSIFGCIKRDFCRCWAT